MSKWFCNTPALSSAISIAAGAAAYMVAKNNPVLAAGILPVAEGIKTNIDGGGSQEAINAIFNQAVTELLGQLKDPVLQASVTGVLASVNFIPNIPARKELDNATIKALVDAFVNGLALAVNPITPASPPAQ